MMIKLWLVFAFSSFALNQATTTLRPVVGIFTQPVPFQNEEILVASYVKYVEAAGARVIPVRYNWSRSKLRKVFGLINGLLLPGGAADLHPNKHQFFRSVSYMFQLAEESNQRGERFPIWGTCLGWEAMAVLVAGNYSVLSDSGPFNQPGNAASILAADRKSRLLRDLPESLFKQLSRQEVVFYAHELGVTLQAFRQHIAKANSPNGDCWHVVATSKDLNGREFVAMAENKCRPYMGVQFHPEKSLYEWYSKLNIPHSLAATGLSRHLIGVLSEELRQSRPSQAREADINAYSIHNMQAKFMGDSYYSQEYIFPRRRNKVLADSFTELAAVA